VIAPDAQRHAIACVSEHGDALSTCTCTRAGTAPPPVRDAARRISVRVSKSICLRFQIPSSNIHRNLKLQNRITDGTCSVQGVMASQPSKFEIDGCPSRRSLQLRSGQFAAPPYVRSIVQMFLKHLECSACGLQHEWSRLQNLCRSCHKPLLAIVDLAAASRTLTRETLATREKSLWRYREVLPLPGDAAPVSLGEGGTPLLRAPKFADDIDLWIKDESLNPTQSFKARGMSVAVSMAKYLGATKLAAPSAGNAGGALAAYAARAGLEAHIFMPRDTPRANIIECRELGAHVTLIDGLITDCGAEIAQPAAAPVSSECGRRSMKWKPWAGSENSAHGCSRCKPAVARRSCARSKPEKKPPRNFPARVRLPPAFAFQRRSAISLS
jgi:hypothetical protein